MRAVVIIAANFLRQMRWLLVIYLPIAIFWGVAMALGNDSIGNSDFDLFFGQQALYAVGISTLLAAQADLNERKSRRILSLLSKGIERRDYLAGLLGGVFASTGVFGFGVLLGALCLIARGRYTFFQVLTAVLLMLLGCCLSATIAMFFATFLHPFLAVIGTGILIGSGWAAQRLGWWGTLVFPVYALNADPHLPVRLGQARFYAVPVALLEITLFWLLAGWVFERRDIAVAIE